MSDIYKEVRNVIHNEIGLTKKDIIIEIEKMMPRLIKSYIGDEYIKSRIDDYIAMTVKNVVLNRPLENVSKGLFDTQSYESYIKHKVDEEIQKHFKENFTVNIAIEKK